MRDCYSGRFQAFIHCVRETAGGFLDVPEIPRLAPPSVNPKFAAALRS
jgi:hypothetical protein